MGLLHGFYLLQHANARILMDHAESPHRRSFLNTASERTEKAQIGCNSGNH
ncbi:unnamed protein product, partial [Musa acuminata var. zebrina]